MIQNMPFSDFQTEFFRLYNSGSHARALEWLRTAGTTYPQQAATLYFWRICLLSLLGRGDEAVAALEEGLELGLWWAESLLRQDADLVSLQGRPDFENLVLMSGDRQVQVQAQSEAAMLVYGPEDQPDGPAPLLIALHSQYGDAQGMAERFKHLTASGWLVAVPQSSQIAYPGGYVWDDRVRARHEVLGLVDQLREEAWIDEQNVVVAGFSQGGALALELVLRGEIQACGVLGIAPYLHETSSIEQIPAGWKANGLRAWLVTGGRDKNQQVFTGVEQLLARRGVRYHREHYPELDHDFPTDFPACLRRALRYFLEGLTEVDLES